MKELSGRVKGLVLVEDVEHLVPVGHVLSNHERAVATSVVDVTFTGVAHLGLNPSSILVVGKGVIETHEEVGVDRDVANGNQVGLLLLVDQGAEVGSPHLESVYNSHLGEMHGSSSGGSTTGVTSRYGVAGHVVRIRVSVVAKLLKCDAELGINDTTAIRISSSISTDMLNVVSPCGLLEKSVFFESDFNQRRR